MLLLASIALAQTAPPIVNGDETDDWEPVGALAYYLEGQGYGVFCSGTLIHPEWVLTAAHCLEAAEDYERYGTQTLFVMGPKGYDQSTWIVWRSADQLHIHGSYSSHGNLGDLNDVGLMHLSEPVTEVTPMPINRASMDDWSEGTPLTFVGYGAVYDNGPGSGTKRYAEIPLYNVQPKVFYAYDSQQNLCSGDSGGAGMRQLDDGSYELVGVNSFVSGGCVGGASGSARVDAVQDWIDGFVDWDVMTRWAPADTGPDALDTADPTTPAENGLEDQRGTCSTGAMGAGWLLGLVGLAALRRRRR